MNIPYRTRHNLKRAAVIGLIVLLALMLVYACWFVWLKRFIVYTKQDGAVLDMSLSAHVADGVVATPPQQTDHAQIYYNEGDNALNISKELTRVSGYYVDMEALRGGTDKIWEQIQKLDKDAPVMLEMKSSKGNFFYSSAVSENRDSKIDAQGVDQLIQKISASGRYMIARIPALRDRAYGLHNVSDGVFDTRGAYLYQDDGGCYWLNPAKQGTIGYLVQIVTELKSLGFDEVVFDYFDFPDTQYKRVEAAEEEKLLTEAANTLVTTCATKQFAVSFVQDKAFALPEGRTRLYMKDAAAVDAASIAQQVSFGQTDARLVFLTEVHDTRFDAYSVFRPLEAAH